MVFFEKPWILRTFNSQCASVVDPGELSSVNPRTFYLLSPLRIVFIYEGALKLSDMCPELHASASP